MQSEKKHTADAQARELVALLKKNRRAIGRLKRLTKVLEEVGDAIGRS